MADFAPAWRPGAVHLAAGVDRADVQRLAGRRADGRPLHRHLQTSSRRTVQVSL